MNTQFDDEITTVWSGMTRLEFEKAALHRARKLHERAMSTDSPDDWQTAALWFEKAGEGVEARLCWEKAGPEHDEETENPTNDL